MKSAYDTELEARIRSNFYGFLIGEIHMMRNDPNFRGKNYDVINNMFRSNYKVLKKLHFSNCLTDGCVWKLHKDKYKCVKCGQYRTLRQVHVEIPDDVMVNILDYAEINPLCICKSITQSALPYYSIRILRSLFTEDEIMKFLGNFYVKLVKHGPTIEIFADKFHYIKNSTYEQINSYHSSIVSKPCETWYILPYCDAKLLIENRAEKIEKRFNFTVRQSIIIDTINWYHTRSRKLSHKTAYLCATASSMGIGYHIAPTFDVVTEMNKLIDDLEPKIAEKIK